MRARTAAVAVVAVCALAGCSQIDALAPVSGGPISTVRNATYIVLVDQEVPVLVAPTCAAVSTGFECTGSTVDGETITVNAAATKPYAMTIKIADATVFEGNASDVLTANLEESP